MKKNVTLNIHKFKKNDFRSLQTKIHKKSDPKRTKKFEKWNLEIIDDSPFSLFLLHLHESEDVTQLATNTVVASCTSLFLFKPESL